MEYTGVENVYLNGTMIGFSREEIDAKLDEILDFADIGDFVYQPVKTYSSGMFVRLAFAVAINIDPEILIVDEALSVGDVFFQAKCYNKFEEFKKMGKTILFVSHDLGSIAKYCDKAVLLDKGRLRAEGAPQDMIDMYKKIMVGVDVDDEEKADTAGTVGSDGLWKDNLNLNPNVDSYGDGKAEIIDIALVDDDGNVTSSIIKGTEFTIKSKVRFYQDVQNPIFTFTFKSVKGTDITGTNSMYEKVNVDRAKQDEVYVASFTQKMSLQGGEYLLSVSCTGFENGEFTAHHRLYDAVNVTVVSDKNTVGFYDMDSRVNVEKI
jgi:teichoic acid transport system ATP-binding protein